MRKRQKTGQETLVSVTVKTMRKPQSTATLQPMKASTPIAVVKQQAATEFGIPSDKIKLLYNKKPVTDSKTIQDVAGDSTDAEFTAMLLGGAIPVEKNQPTEAVVAEASLLDTSEFWEDLRGFLLQRLKNETEAETAFSIFEKSWKRSQR